MTVCGIVKRRSYTGLPLLSASIAQPALQQSSVATTTFQTLPFLPALPLPETASVTHTFLCISSIFSRTLASAPNPPIPRDPSSVEKHTWPASTLPSRPPCGHLHKTQPPPGAPNHLRIQSPAQNAYTKL